MIQANWQFNLTRWLFFILYISKVIKSYECAKCEATRLGWEKLAIHLQCLLLNKEQPRAPRALSSVEVAELPCCSSVSAAKQGCWVIWARLSRGVCIPILTVQVHFFKIPNKLRSWDKCNSYNSIGRNPDSHIKPSALQEGLALS